MKTIFQQEKYYLIHKPTNKLVEYSCIYESDKTPIYYGLRLQDEFHPSILFARKSDSEEILSNCKWLFNLQKVNIDEFELKEICVFYKAEDKK